MGHQRRRSACGPPGTGSGVGLPWTGTAPPTGGPAGTPWSERP